jgi:hypothetical protein
VVAQNTDLRAIVLVSANPIYHVGGDIKAALLGGGNMPAIHLAMPSVAT